MHTLSLEVHIIYLSMSTQSNSPIDYIQEAQENIKHFIQRFDINKFLKGQKSAIIRGKITKDLNNQEVNVYLTMTAELWKTLPKRGR